MTDEPIDFKDAQAEESTPIMYPGVSNRVKAAVTDSFVLIIFMMSLTYLFSLFEHVPENARIAGFIFIFGLYDPIFTSSFGGTIGHFLFGIRVKRKKNQAKNIIFPFAIIRYITKILLGWISLITVSSDEMNLALHDMVAGSIVIYKKSNNIKPKNK